MSHKHAKMPGLWVRKTILSESESESALLTEDFDPSVAEEANHQKYPYKNPESNKKLNYRLSINP